MFMRFAPLLFASVLSMQAPARAATCTEGLIMLEQTLRKVALNDEQFTIVTDLMFKAKIEADRGNTHKCVYIVEDIIKLVFLKNTN
jgi:hypothetical protein